MEATNQVRLHLPTREMAVQTLHERRGKLSWPSREPLKDGEHQGDPGHCP